MFLSIMWLMSQELHTTLQFSAIQIGPVHENSLAYI